MSNRLADLIAAKTGETATADADFTAAKPIDPTASAPVTSAPAAPAPAAAAKPASRKRKPASAASGTSASDLVRGAMEMAGMIGEGELASDGDVTIPTIGDAPADGYDFTGRLDPIKRANGEAYTPRPVDSKTDIEILRGAREYGAHVMLYGYPGCGKTAATEAAHLDELVTIEGSGDTEVADLIGTYVQQPDGSYKWVDGPLLVAMKGDGKRGYVLLVDDCTLIPAPVLARLYPAMDGRRRIRVTEHEGEIVEALPGFTVVGAHNPGAPGAILSDALSSRFTIHIEVESDLSLATKMGVDRRIVKVARNLRSRRDGGKVKVRKEDGKGFKEIDVPAGTSSWAPEMRELLGFQRAAKIIGLKLAVRNLISIAPEDARDAVIEALAANGFDDVTPLKVSED